MNIPFLKKPSIKFYTDFPEISDQYPIIPSREYKRSWVRNCAKAFSRYKEKVNNSRSLITATKCPGIRNVMEKGFIVQSWFDFTIETTDKDFKVFYPDNLETHLKNIGYQNPLINSFDTKYSPLQIPTGNSLPHIIKIWTPYHFEVPKDYELLVLPIQYDDNLSFSACTGSISGFEIDFNVHVFWHEKNKRVHIPAGTPLCQIVPIKKSDIKIDTLTSTSKVKSEVKKRKFKKYSKFQL